MEQIKREEEQIKNFKSIKAREQDRALFDFDEDINQLEEVREKPVEKTKIPQKYQIKQSVRPVMPAHVLAELDRLKAEREAKVVKKEPN